MKTTPSFLFLLKTRLAGKNFLYEFYFKNKKTLDVACGEGYFLKYNKNLIHGFDVNEIAIKRLSSSGFHVKVADVGSMPYLAGEFEMVKCHNVIEHLHTDKAYAMLVECGRVLQKEGYLVLSSEILTRKFWGTFEHIKPYPPGSILKLLKEDGKGEFGGLSVFEYVGLFYMGDYYKNRLMYFISVFLGFYTRLFRREYFLILRKK